MFNEKPRVERSGFLFLVRWGEPGNDREEGDVTALVTEGASGAIRCWRCNADSCLHTQAVIDESDPRS